MGVRGTLRRPGAGRWLALFLALSAISGIAVYGWFGLAGPRTPSSACPANCPLAANIALQSPEETTIGADQWYNFTVEYTASGIALSNLDAQVLTATGEPVVPTGAWTFSDRAAGGAVVGTFVWSDSAWSSTSPATVATGQFFVLELVGSPGLQGAGDSLSLTVLTGPEHGSVGTAIP